MPIEIKWNDEDPEPVSLAALRESFGPDFGAGEAISGSAEQSQDRVR